MHINCTEKLKKIGKFIISSELCRWHHIYFMFVGDSVRPAAKSIACVHAMWWCLWRWALGIDSEDSPLNINRRMVSAHINFDWGRLSASATRGSHVSVIANNDHEVEEEMRSRAGARNRNKNKNCKISFHFYQHQKLLTSWAVELLCTRAFLCNWNFSLRTFFVPLSPSTRYVCVCVLRFFLPILFYSCVVVVPFWWFCFCLSSTLRHL